MHGKVLGRSEQAVEKAVIARSDSDEAIPNLLIYLKARLLRFARNDQKMSFSTPCEHQTDKIRMDLALIYLHQESHLKTPHLISKQRRLRGEVANGLVKPLGKGKVILCLLPYGLNSAHYPLRGYLLLVHGPGYGLHLLGYVGYYLRDVFAFL